MINREFSGIVCYDQARSLNCNVSCLNCESQSVIEVLIVASAIQSFVIFFNPQREFKDSLLITERGICSDI